MKNVNFIFGMFIIICAVTFLMLGLELVIWLATQIARDIPAMVHELRHAISH